MVKNFIPQLRALNWAKLGLYAVILAAAFGAGWLISGNRERVQCEQEHAQDLAVQMAYMQGQIDEYNEELKRRISVANEASTNAAQLQAQLDRIGGGINEEITKRAPAASCGPSDREYELYKEAARSTRDN